jgi:predicted PurR-regulated permease PerM
MLYITNMSEPFKSGNFNRIFAIIMIFFFCIVITAVMKITAPVILPVTIAILLAFVLQPLVSGLEKLHIPRIVSIALVVILVVAGLYVLGMVSFSSGRAILSRYPQYERRLTDIYLGLSRFFQLSYDQDMSFIENLWNQIGVREKIWNMTYSLSNAFIGFLKNAVVILFFVIFLLVEASHFKEKLELAFDQRIGRFKRMGADIMNQIGRYMAAKFLMSLINGVVFAISLSLMKVEFAFVWAVIQFFFNFIPTLGSIASGFMICLFALLQFWPEPGPVIMVVVFVIAANIILGFILDPKIVGDNVGISPLVVLVSLLLWSWLWGFAGMVIAVPMMVIIKIVCENFTFLEPVSILLSSRKTVWVKKSAHENQKDE